MVTRSLVLIFFCILSLKTLSSEGDTYNFSWLDPDKEVFVLQNRKYRKKGNFYFNAGYGITTSGAFVDATTIQGRAGYFFMEEFGFELVYAVNSGEENETASTLRNKGGVGARPFRRIVEEYTGGLILWSPFYSKINTFNQIIYLDWIIGLGYASINETNNKIEFESGGTSTGLTTLSHSGLMWNFGMKFYLNESWDIRADLTTIHYQATQPNRNSSEQVKAWYSNWDASLAIGFRF